MLTFTPRLQKIPAEISFLFLSRKQRSDFNAVTLESS